MTTSALAALRASAVAATDPYAKAETLGRVGLCLAQLGRIDEARLIAEQLRQDFSSGHAPRISIRAMLLEGVISYYADLVDSSDRVRRALVLAKAGGASDLTSEASVWLAHLAFNFERYPELRQALSDALLGFSDLDDSHRARTCLIIADALQYLADRTAASDWYLIARILSRRVHDHAVMTAIEYNRLSIGLSRIRVDKVLRRPETGILHRDWLLELGSVKRLHLGFDSKALAELLDLCDAYSCEIRGDYKGALVSLESIQRIGAAGRCGVSDLLLRLEMDWCRAKALDDRSDAVPELMSSISIDELEGLSRNEQLIALGFLRDISEKYYITLDKERCERLSYAACHHFEKTLSEMANIRDLAHSSLPKVRRFVQDGSGMP